MGSKQHIHYYRMIEVEVVQTSQAKNKFERLGIVEMFAVGLGNNTYWDRSQGK